MKEELKWLMSGIGVPEIIVIAKTFDEAIEKSRTIDERYCGGQVFQIETERG